MSVAAVITYRMPPGSNDRPGYLPVATETDYNAYWRPLAARLDLELVAQFGVGISVDTDQFDDLLAELVVLQRVAGQSGRSGDEQVSVRAQLLIDLVGNLDRGQVQELFIG